MRVTGLGSLPGTDFGAAVRFAFDRTPDLPYLPELPARGPSAQLVGRGLGLLAGLGADLVVGQWRLGSAGLDQRRARALLRDDLDVLEENAEGYAGPFKVSVAGPWTLAAATDLAAGGTVLADAGARRDLAASLAEGVGDLLGDLGRRLPGADLVLQVDEPSLPAVLGGRVPTPGGFFRQRAIGLPEVAAGLAAVTAEPARRGLAVPAVLHCCAPGAPVDTLLGEGRDGAGFAGVSLDLDTLAAGLEAGREFWAGCLPTANGTVAGVDATRARVLRLVESLGVSSERAATQVVLTPACGLAGFTPAAAAKAFDVLARAAGQVEDELAG
jgi:methionine synthase II (cobalamin-independent)